MKVIGLDVSTSCTGVALLEGTSVSYSILKLDHIDFKKCVTFWDKADHVRQVFDEWKQLPEFQNIDKVAVEAAMMRFSPGMSSMQAISTLLRFNGLVSYLAYQAFGIQPIYISVGHARKLCGLKMQQKAASGGLTHKQQTAAHMLSHDLVQIQWPLKKNGNVKDFVYDIIDSYVIARAGLVG